MSSKRLLLAATTAAALVWAAPAAAAPDRTAPDFTSAPGTYTWTGKLGVGIAPLTQVDQRIPCGTPGHDCDYTLFHTTAPGTLSAVSSTADKQSVDVDLYIYESDASGTQGELWSSSTGGTADEAVTADATGNQWWLVVANYATVVGGTYNGVASFTPSS
jgi:hypothetical protein